MYQLFIAPSKGSNCPMHPHCSLYGQMAFERCNPIQSFIMTADRLHRCGHDLTNYDPIEINDSVRFEDLLPDLRSEKRQVDLVNASSDPAFILSQFNEQSEDSRIFAFAEELFRKRDFNRAITEYQRLIIYFPDSAIKPLAAKRLLQCYYQSGQYLEAVHLGQEMIRNGFVRNDEMEVEFYIGASYFRLKNFSKARAEFQKITGGMGDKASLLIGLAFVNEEKWEEAQKSFTCILPESELYKKAEQLKELACRGPSLGQKNPKVAGILAIVPGMGYLYDGYKQTALSSFIVNGLFFWATADAFKKDNDGLKPIMGILSLGWYAGNIYGSAVSAYRKNERIKKDFLNRFDVGFDF